MINITRPPGFRRVVTSDLAAGHGATDPNCEVFTTVVGRPRINRTLIARNSKPQVLLLRQDKRTDTPAEMFGQAEGV
jgi:hypothetical protein